MDIHHVLNHIYSAKYFSSFKKETGLSIALPTREHFLLTKNRVREMLSIEDLIKEELNGLKNYTNIPADLILLLQENIENRYIT